MLQCEAFFNLRPRELSHLLGPEPRDVAALDIGTTRTRTLFPPDALVCEMQSSGKDVSYFG